MLDVLFLSQGRDALATGQKQRNERRHKSMTIPQTASSPPEPQPHISRRTLLKGSAAVMAMGAALPSVQGAAVAQSGSGTPNAASPKGKVIDCHAHLNHHSRSTWEADDRKLIEAADKLGIDQLCCSPLTPHWPATLDGFRECNQWTAHGMRGFPGRVLGHCCVHA